MIELINQLLAVLLPLLATAVGGWAALTVKNTVLPHAIAWLRAHLNDQQLEFLHTLAQDAVDFAEAKGYTAEAKLLAEQKKALALNWLTATLAARGLRVDAVVLEGLVESAWANSWGTEKLQAGRAANVVAVASK